MDDNFSNRCFFCNAPLPPRTRGRGQPRKYCSDRCRTADYRQRAAVAAAKADLQPPTSAEQEPLTEADFKRAGWRAIAGQEAMTEAEQERTLWELAGLPLKWTGSDEEVVEAILTGRHAASAFAALGDLARPALAWRCAAVAKALRAALDEYFDS